MNLVLAVAIAATSLPLQPESSSGFAQAERLVRERHPTAILRRLDHERENGKESLEAEIVLDARQGFLLLRWDEAAGWSISSATWRVASSRYRRLLSRIETDSQGAISAASAIAAVRERYPRAVVSEIELEFQGTRLVYEIELREGPVEFEAYVDARTGLPVEDANGADPARPGIDSLIALLPATCVAGVPVGFRASDGVLELIMEPPDSGIDGTSPPPCDKLRRKIDLIARLFQGMHVELIEGSLRDDGGWVLRCTIRVGTEIMRLNVDAGRGTVLADFGQADGRP